jgi:Spy/CpxP family protein refolding chaperone
MNRLDPIIEKIELTEEQKQEIRDIMDDKPTKKHIERWDKEER